MPIVILKTNHGDITLKLDAEKAPITTENFVQYVEAGHYNNTLFHRVIGGFMIQGGGLNPDMSNKAARPPIQNEADNGLLNKVGTIAMARTNDPHSATSQFFINVADNTFLNHRDKSPDGWGYCVFGTVIDGLDKVMEISHVNTVNRNGYQAVPEREVIIESASVVPELEIQKTRVPEMK